MWTNPEMIVWTHYNLLYFAVTDSDVLQEDTLQNLEERNHTEWLLYNHISSAWWKHFRKYWSDPAMF